ncbi:MAG: hypothetical protein WCI11_19890 [Candidatus Methylumidiphilus sp.]
MWGYVLIAGVLGFLPGIAFGLILVEVYMVFGIAHGYGVDNTGEIALFCFKAGVISAALKAVAHALHFAPVIGQIANSIVAIVFVVILYNIADSHYEHLAKVGRHPDIIQQAPQTQLPKK